LPRPAAGSAESQLEASLIKWKLAEHVPKASQTLGAEPFIGLESPRAQLAHLINERFESIESLNSALDELDQLNDDEQEKRLPFVPATRDDVLERDELLPVAIACEPPTEHRCSVFSFLFLLWWVAFPRNDDFVG
jgi:hypothetical protein